MSRRTARQQAGFRECSSFERQSERKKSTIPCCVGLREPVETDSNRARLRRPTLGISRAGLSLGRPDDVGRTPVGQEDYAPAYPTGAPFRNSSPFTVPCWKSRFIALFEGIAMETLERGRPEGGPINLA